MKFTQMRNEVKMLLTELNMLFLKFVVLMFLFFALFFSFTYLQDFFLQYLQYSHCVSLCICPLFLSASE